MEMGTFCRFCFVVRLPDEKVLAKYRVAAEHDAELLDPVRKVSFEEDGFYAEVKRETVEYFKQKDMDWKAPLLHQLLFVFNVVFQLTALYFMIVNESYLWAFVHAMLRGFMVVRSTHAASHFSFSRNASINRWVYRIGTVMIGLWSPTTWDLQHLVAHHIYTNEWPYDSDSAFPLKSIVPTQKRFFYHRFQHIYMWLVYALTIPLVMLNSIRESLAGHQMVWTIDFKQPGVLAEALCCSIGGVIYLVLPTFFMAPLTALGLISFSAVISSLYFSLQFIVNHEVDEVIPTAEHPDRIAATMLPPAKPADKAFDWGLYQMENSLTFAPGSRFALEAAGGLNTQIEHHLFPGVHYSHYSAVGEIIRRVAERRGHTYISKPNLLEALKSHYLLLKNPLPSIRTSSKKGKSQ
jgi:fatty acid desaturase